MRLAIDHVSIAVPVEKGTKDLLNDVSAVFGPRELVAVMGPSGSGKTTLLGAVFGGVKPTSGSVTVNGQQFDADTAKTFMALVPQDDVLFSELTPYETLLDQTMFKTTLSPSAAKERVEQLLSQFGLQVCKDVRVGDPRLQQTGLSGGQKKRLSVAIELVSNPSLLALDEPTSGLDSVSALVLVKAMKELAQSGATIISTIHQPSYPIFTTFDSLLLLHAGKTCYVGPVDEREPLAFFAQAGAACPVGHNPADFIMDIVSEYTELELAKLHESATARAEKLLLSVSAKGDEATVLPVPAPVRPLRSILLTLMRRGLRKMFRDPALVVVRILGTVIVALIFSGVAADISFDADGVTDLVRVAYMFLFFSFLISMLPGILAIAPEMPQICMEYRNNYYSPEAYLTSKLVIETPFVVIPSLLFTVIVSPISNGADDSDGFDFGTMMLLFALSFAVCFCFTAVGNLVASLAPTFEAALFVGPALCEPLLLLSGVLRNMADITWVLRWVDYVNPLQYSWRFLAWALLHRKTFTFPGGIEVTGREILVEDLKLSHEGQFDASTQSGAWASFAMIFVIAVALYAAAFASYRHRLGTH